MNEDFLNREYLVVGATGMLYDFCKSITSDKLVISCRFESNKNNIDMIGNDVAKIELDYTDECSKNEFLNEIRKYKNLKYAILWIHSYANDFSLELMTTLYKINKDIEILHLFSSSVDSADMEEYARENNIKFTALRLGRVEVGTSWRWMTNSEISLETRKCLDKLEKSAI